MIRTVIYDDNGARRESLQALIQLTPDFEFAGSFENCANIKEDILATNPDVILMDIEMPGLNGIEVTKHVNDVFPEIKILIQTVFNESEKIFQALCAGASGYILKNDPPHKYLEAINEVYNGGAPISASVAKKVLGFFANKNVVLTSPGTTDYLLSDREKEILHLMVEGHNYKDIADKSFISYETVRTHVKHIYKKLHVASRSEAVTKAIQQRLH